MRTANVSKHDLCHYCLNDGLVVAATATEQEEKDSGYGDLLAPCPFCEKGRALEFSEDPADRNTKLPWDPETGYWKGRDTSFLKPHLRPVELSIDEQKQHLAALKKSLPFLLSSVDGEIEPKKERVSDEAYFAAIAAMREALKEEKADEKVKQQVDA